MLHFLLRKTHKHSVFLLHISAVLIRNYYDLDIEAGKLNNPKEDHNLSQFFQEVGAIKIETEEITNLLSDIWQLHEETKCNHSAKVLRGLRDRMESDMVALFRKARIIKSTVEDQNVHHKWFGVKLRDMMHDIQSLRDKVLSDHKDDLKKRFYTATGEVPSEEVTEKLISGSLKVEFMAGKTDNADLGVRHEAVMDIQRSLKKLHQVFLDMAILVETQREAVDSIEDNVASAGNYIHGGTNSLYHAN
ncbi:syntaxin 1B/2/3 [Spatholobus suberectus]|nr:syntaxin 1B/2/3 [Spatholobus suberectus]